MHADLKIGNKFPDFELPDHSGEIRKLSPTRHFLATPVLLQILSSIETSDSDRR